MTWEKKVHKNTPPLHHRKCLQWSMSFRHAPSSYCKYLWGHSGMHPPLIATACGVIQACTLLLLQVPVGSFRHAPYPHCKCMWGHSGMHPLLIGSTCTCGVIQACTLLLLQVPIGPFRHAPSPHCKCLWGHSDMHLNLLMEQQTLTSVILVFTGGRFKMGETIENFKLTITRHLQCNGNQFF